MNFLDITVGDTTIRLSADAAHVIPAFAAAQVFERHWSGTLERKPEKEIRFAFIRSRHHCREPGGCRCAQGSRGEQPALVQGAQRRRSHQEAHRRA